MRVAAKSVLIVGIGGLGVPAATVLAASGSLRRLGLMDDGVVELSNLPRQVIYDLSDLGDLKVEAAVRHLARASAVAIETYEYALGPSNAAQMVSSYDFVIDATDNPAAKFLINDSCVEAGVPFVYAGVLGLKGQLMTVVPGRTSCLRCLFEEPPVENEGASCREAGIIGPVAGLIGLLQAQEAMSWLEGAVPRLAGKLLVYDAARTNRIRVLPVSPRPGCGCGAASTRHASTHAPEENR
jgi:molybdopterin-synthase adenylyltransferase